MLGNGIAQANGVVGKGYLVDVTHEVGARIRGVEAMEEGSITKHDGLFRRRVGVPHNDSLDVIHLNKG